MAYLYRHVRLDKNEPFYIGIGISPNRCKSKNNRNKHWKNIVKLTNYRIDILLNNLTWEEACKKEKEFIKLYGRKDLKLGPLVNLTDGGDGGCGYVMSDETKLKMSIANSGENNGFFKKSHSNESKEKMSQSAKGRIITEEVKNKISNSLSGENCFWFGKKLSEEHKKKLSERATGHSTSEDTKLKLRKNSPKGIRLYKIINNELITYYSLREVELKYNIHRKTIMKHRVELGFMTKDDINNTFTLPEKIINEIKGLLS